MANEIDTRDGYITMQIKWKTADAVREFGTVLSKTRSALKQATDFLAAFDGVDPATHLDTIASHADGHASWMKHYGEDAMKAAAELKALITTIVQLKTVQEMK